MAIENLWELCVCLCTVLRIPECGEVNAITIRPNKKISELQVTGLKIIGRVVIHIFFLEKKLIILCILKGISKCIKLYFSRIPEKI